MRRAYRILPQTARYAVTGFCLAALVLSLCCCAQQETRVVSADSVILSPDQQQGVRDSVESLVEALSTGDQFALEECAEDSLDLYYDQTLFQNITTQLTECKLDGIDFDSVSENKTGYMIDIAYTLTYSGSHYDEESVWSEPGKYSYTKVFTFDRDSLKIKNIQRRTAG